jgi:hypothetical protein
MTTASDIGQCLQNTLSSDPNTRISAELKLGELLALPGVLIAQSDRGDPFFFTRSFVDAFYRCWIGIIAHRSRSGCGYVIATDE